MRLVAVALLLTLVPPADAAPRPGKVVRVERARTGSRGIPRVCQIRPEDGSGNCWGRAPIRGESAVVVDPNGRHGTVTIGEVTPKEDHCGMPAWWEYRFDVAEGDLKTVQAYQTWALIDLDTGPGARAVDAGSDPVKEAFKQLATADARQGFHDGAQPFAAFDRDGNSTPDVIVLAYPCDAQGDLTRPSSAQQGYCMEYWLQPRGARWTFARRDIVQICTR